MKILAINPGSTSTKIGIFSGGECVKAKTITHSSEDLSQFPSLIDQLDYRKDLVEKAIAEEGMTADGFDGIIGRGGLLRPIESGVYKVNQAMIVDLQNSRYGTHASSLGGLLAQALASQTGKDAYIADPVVVDELCPEARITGHPLFPKVSIFHALNHKAVAKRHCLEQGLTYNESALIVAHMGGGVSIGLHKNGKVADVNDALYGEGPFSPERSGGLTVRSVVNVCFSGDYTKNDVLRMIQPKGGLVAHLGTNDLRDAEKMAETDEHAALLIKTMAYTIAKSIGALAAAAHGKVDGTLLTGGMAKSASLVGMIKEYVEFIAPVFVYPGEDELQALAQAMENVLNGEGTMTY